VRAENRSRYTLCFMQTFNLLVGLIPTAFCLILGEHNIHQIERNFVTVSLRILLYEINADPKHCVRLSTSVADPGYVSRILIFYPSWIPDLGSRI
jgi:hypothetical protein